MVLCIRDQLRLGIGRGGKGEAPLRVGARFERELDRSAQHLAELATNGFADVVRDERAGDRCTAGVDDGTGQGAAVRDDHAQFTARVPQIVLRREDRDPAVAAGRHVTAVGPGDTEASVRIRFQRLAVDEDRFAVPTADDRESCNGFATQIEHDTVVEQLGD